MRNRQWAVLALCAVLFSNCSAQPTSKKLNDTPDTGYVFKSNTEGGTGKRYMGREIAQVMDASGGDWLERNERQKEENTSLTIEKMKLLPNSIVADIGAGTGYYTFRIAKKIPRGKIYAVEIQDEFIRFLKNKKNALKDSVVSIVKGDSASPNLPANSIDLAFMVDVYHELEFPKEMLQSIYTALKPTGKLLLIEYRAEDPSIQIKQLHKTSVKQLGKELNANGFVLDYDGEFLPIQHFLLYKKKN